MQVQCVHQDLLAGLLRETTALFKLLENFPFSDEIVFTMDKLKSYLSLCRFETDNYSRHSPYCSPSPAPSADITTHGGPCPTYIYPSNNIISTKNKNSLTIDTTDNKTGLILSPGSNLGTLNIPKDGPGTRTRTQFVRKNSLLVPIETKYRTCTYSDLAMESTKYDSTSRNVIKTLMSYRLNWTHRPRKALIIKKWKNALISKLMIQIIEFLIEKYKINIYLEERVLIEEKSLFEKFQLDLTQETLQNKMGEGDDDGKDIRNADNTCYNHVHKWDGSESDTSRSLDFIICLGGDGTILYASSLFQKSMPPVMSFHLGTLGFLTPFEFVKYKEYLTGLVQSQYSVSFRSRFHCKIVRKDLVTPSAPLSLSGNMINYEENYQGNNAGSNSINSVYTGNKDDFVALNEVVIGRGAASYLGTLELYVDDKLITKVQADGLIIASPTGSTAYSLSAGGPMVHPNVPGILITPICPHSLSFRPIVIPDTCEVTVLMPLSNRASRLWISMDGRNNAYISPGDRITINCSEYYIPQVMKSDQHTDWVSSLTTCLSWNTRGHVHTMPSDPLLADCVLTDNDLEEMDFE